MTISPALSVRSALFRAAMHAMPKGQLAESLPNLAGVRIERVSAGGVNIVATDGHELLIWLRDPEGFIGCDATVQIQSAFFEAARRAQREAGARGRDDSLLIVNQGEAHLSPGAGPRWPAYESGIPYIDWRNEIPERAARRAAPPVSPESLDRLNAATQILSSAGLVTKFTFESSEHGDVAVMNWGLVGFAIATAQQNAESLPWRAPLTSMLAPQEMRAS